MRLPAGGHEPSPTIARAFQDVRGDGIDQGMSEVDFQLNDLNDLKICFRDVMERW
jgi:hypothetical protein